MASDADAEGLQTLLTPPPQLHQRVGHHKLDEVGGSEDDTRNPLTGFLKDRHGQVRGRSQRSQ